MKHSDFHIGLEFLASAGLRWRCTDVGTRTILAIRVDSDDPNWYQGPPYIAREVVFDEKDMEGCHRALADAIAFSAQGQDATRHPGYSAEAVSKMLDARYRQTYPHEGVLRFDRRRPDGEILHPYAGRKEQGAWMVDLYLPFLNAYEAMRERDFIALPRASAQDIKARSEKSP